MPIVGASVGVDGSDARVRARLARPRVVFGALDSRATTLIFSTPVTTRADGLIGPNALPHDRINFVLGPELAGARDIVFQLDDSDRWAADATLGGQPTRVSFDFGNPATVFNRAAAHRYDASGQVVAAGDLVQGPMMLGLTTLMQPVTTELTLEGLALGPARVLTNAPLLGADDPDTIVVQAEGDNIAPAGITLGREAMARCVSIRLDRRARQMTLRCAP